MRILGKDGTTPITSVDSWLRLAPPTRKEYHWKDYASAKELARAWFPDAGEGPFVPEELCGLLASHSMIEMASFERSEGRAELRVEIDAHGGNDRNTDLALVCDVVSNERGPLRAALSIEAKAYERFGGTVKGAIRASETRRAKGLTSNGDARAEGRV